MKKYNSVIIIPDEGYTVNIYDRAMEIYKQLISSQMLPLIIVSGATRNPEAQKAYGLKKFLEKFFRIISVHEQIERMKAQGIPMEDVLYEGISMHTRDNAMNSLGIIKELGICTKRIYLIGSFEGMLRRYLTFKKANAELGLDFNIKTALVFNFFPIGLTIARLLLIPGEFFRIWKYHKLGHI